MKIIIFFFVAFFIACSQAEVFECEFGEEAGVHLGGKIRSSGKTSYTPNSSWPLHELDEPSKILIDSDKGTVKIGGSSGTDDDIYKYVPLGHNRLMYEVFLRPEDEMPLFTEIVTFGGRDGNVTKVTWFGANTVSVHVQLGYCRK
ncbi:hypothetical protein [uncultured Porticoccus sp.]|uniref:hypothetical protein n=1 Tax=uncultured Porticoccus sp. TaxID=1256050 RepID=UPI0030D8ACD9